MNDQVLFVGCFLWMESVIKSVAHIESIYPLLKFIVTYSEHCSVLLTVDFHYLIKLICLFFSFSLWFIVCIFILDR